MAKTLRLLYPQWQGGNVPEYGIGARLLDGLAPDCAAVPAVNLCNFPRFLPIFTRNSSFIPS